jgi:hypothetical protein
MKKTRTLSMLLFAVAAMAFTFKSFTARKAQEQHHEHQSCIDRPESKSRQIRAGFDFKSAIQAFLHSPHQ